MQRCKIDYAKKKEKPKEGGRIERSSGRARNEKKGEEEVRGKKELLSIKREKSW
jgi:hypothetical protein